MYGTFADNMAEPEPTSVKETVEDTVEIIDYDSDELNEEFEDASDSVNEGPQDLTRPSDWRPTEDEHKFRVGEHESDDLSNEEKLKEDSLGHDQNSPDYIDEDMLRSWEVGEDALSESQLEQKRLEAAQYKLEGNALYTEGKTSEACGE